MTPLRDDPLSSKADIVTEPCQWSPNEHIHLPAPEEVFSAPVLSKKDGSVVAKVTELLVVKYGRRVFPREVAAIRYVSAHTSIPVPQIRGTYKYDSQVFFFMDFMPGRSLDEVWPEMTPAAKSILVEQLRDHYSRLKSLTETYIGGLGRTPAFDTVFENLKSDDRGPFSSVTAFHDALYRAFKVCIDRNSPLSGSNRWCSATDESDLHGCCPHGYPRLHERSRFRGPHTSGRAATGTENIQVQIYSTNIESR
ncbi:Protein kinase-like domain protein [Sparassis crispa]|uniref:Protein kinase-like domain protein n=1 Tax=Sparassis crispa TaxID=139825 RepID=A0A401GYM5_9APHY|nr:Protein kinase-like domain protein [Sparassis crispa]GBE87260.1 Protein kinase-like domain protein [Sparassis crispa]